MNNVIIRGNIATDEIKLRSFNSGKMHCVDFTLAFNNKHSKKKKDTVYWFKCQAWGKTAQMIANTMERGMNVIIQGSLKQNIWVDKNDRTHYDVIINCSFIEFGYRKTKHTKASAKDYLAEIEKEAAAEILEEKEEMAQEEFEEVINKETYKYDVDNN